MEQEFRAFAADLALVIEPAHPVDFEVIEATEQPVCAVLAGTYPLAGRGVLRLRDCLAGPQPEYRVRHPLEHATKVRSMAFTGGWRYPPHPVRGLRAEWPP